MKSVISTISYYTVNFFSFLDNSLYAAICLLKYTVFSRNCDATCVRCFLCSFELARVYPMCKELHEGDKKHEKALKSRNNGAA